MQNEVVPILLRLFAHGAVCPKTLTFGSELLFVQFHHIISRDRTSDIVLPGITVTSPFNAHL